MNLKNLPQGWAPVIEAIKRIVWRKHPSRGAKERDVAEVAWRELCGHAFEGRIRAVIRTESGVALEADCAQFIALQERYLFNAGTQGYWLENERRYCELGIEPEDKFLDKHGRSVRGQLLFSESDIETASGVPVSLEKPSFDEGCEPDKKPLPAAEPLAGDEAPDVETECRTSALLAPPTPQTYLSRDQEVIKFMKEGGFKSCDKAVKAVQPAIRRARGRTLWRKAGLSRQRGRPSS